MEEGITSAPAASEPPKNPGSAKHPHDCKPCNKFNPARRDSCKHGDACEFCHCPEHVRPKHRGQRGRHALQRRQYLDHREELSQVLRLSMDQIYRVPHAVCEDLKKRLNREPPKERDRLMGVILEGIREVGERAQLSRPDSTRLRGPRIQTAESMGSVVELDGRCKWLVGTLHLMLRKMADAEASEEEVREKVNNILREVEDLRARLEAALDVAEPKPELQAALREASLEADCSWLQNHLIKLVHCFYKQPTSNDMHEDFLGKLQDVRKVCEGVPDHIGQEHKDEILKSPDVDALLAQIQEVREKILNQLFGTESLEDLDEFEPEAAALDFCSKMPDKYEMAK